jgi:hypothetical protein
VGDRQARGVVQNGAYFGVPPVGDRQGTPLQYGLLEKFAQFVAKWQSGLPPPALDL